MTKGGRGKGRESEGKVKVGKVSKIMEHPAPILHQMVGVDSLAGI